MRYTPADRTGHVPMPRTGTYTRVNGGGRASLLAEADYPVTAECKICEGKIRLDHLLQMDWRHVPAGSTS